MQDGTTGKEPAFLLSFKTRNANILAYNHKRNTARLRVECKVVFLIFSMKDPRQF